MAFTEKLIELVKKYPILYDLSHEDYKNVRKKDKVWQQIGVELKESGDEVKKKWKNLRDTYMRHIKTNKTKTGQAAKTGKKWRWSDQMEAFCPFFSFAKTSSNVTEIPNINDDTNEEYAENIHNEDSQPQLLENNSNLDTVDTESDEKTSKNPIFINLATTSESALALDSTSPSFSTSTPTRKRKSKNESRPTSSVEFLISYFQNKKKPEIDEIDLLFLAHAQTIKTFSKKRQAIAKMKVSQAIMEQEIQNLEEQSSTQQNQDNLFRPIRTTSSASSDGRSQSNSPTIKLCIH